MYKLNNKTKGTMYIKGSLQRIAKVSAVIAAL